MVDVGQKEGGASPPKPIFGLKSPQPENTNNSNSEDGSGGMVKVVGTRGWERAHPSRYAARKIHNRKGTNPRVQMVNLQDYRDRGWR